jgi:hypothetical protein
MTFFEKDVPYYAQHHRDLCALPGAAGCASTASSRRSSARPAIAIRDADVAMVTSYCPDGALACALVLDAPVPCRACYDLDTPATLEALESGQRVPYIPDVRLELERPVLCDGRLAPGEWIATSEGRGMKVDAVSHGDDHFFPRTVRRRVDLGGAIVEWEVEPCAIVERYVRTAASAPGRSLTRLSRGLAGHGPLFGGAPDEERRLALEAERACARLSRLVTWRSFMGRAPRGVRTRPSRARHSLADPRRCLFRA